MLIRILPHTDRGERPVRIRPFRPTEPDRWLLAKDHAKESGLASAARDQGTLEHELLRQWILRELIESYLYPRQWCGTRIVPAGPSEAEREPPVEGFRGLYFLTSKGDPFLLVAVAPPGARPTAEEALKAGLAAVECCGLGVCADGTSEGTRVLRKRFDTAATQYVPDLEPYSTPGLATPQAYLRTDDATAGLQELLSARVESLLFEAHCLRLA